MGVCSPFLQILTLFSTKKCDFPHLFSDLAFRQKLFYRYLDEKANKKILQIHFEFLFLPCTHLEIIETITTFIHSHSSLENHTRFQTKMGKVYTRLQTKTAQKPHPRGAAHTCIAYIREFPPGGAGTKCPSRRSPSRRELTVHQNFIKESTSTM